MREGFLSFSPPFLGEEEIAEVLSTLRSDWISTGPKTRRFEQEFAAFLGSPAALALSSGSGALHVGLAALGIRRGDTVITTPMTFCSTAHVIEHMGAHPLFVDVEPDTLNIDAARVRETVEELARGGTRTGLRINKTLLPRMRRVKAILPVHLYGHPCDMDPLLDVARKHRLAVLEDAAHALPARYRGSLIGAATTANRGPAEHVSRLVSFSFYATKNVTTAEGGMLVGDADLVEEARLWSLHGMSRDAFKRYTSEGDWHYEVIRPGFKYNMTDIQASIGLHQLGRLGAFQRRRLAIVQRYDQAFQRLEELEPPARHPEVDHAWHIYALRLRLDRLRISRQEFIAELRERNIGSSVHFIPLHLHRYYRERYGYEPEDFPVTYREFQRLVSLPVYPRMTEQDVDDVIAAVEEIISEHWKR